MTPVICLFAELPQALPRSPAKLAAGSATRIAKGLLRCHGISEGTKISIKVEVPSDYEIQRHKKQVHCVTFVSYCPLCCHVSFGIWLSLESSLEYYLARPLYIIFMLSRKVLFSVIYKSGQLISSWNYPPHTYTHIYFPVPNLILVFLVVRVLACLTYFLLKKKSSNC